MPKKIKVEITSVITGKRVSFRQLKKEMREVVPDSVMARKLIVKSGLLSRAQIDKAVKLGALQELIFNEEIYYNKAKYLRYLEWLMGLKKG